MVFHFEGASTPSHGEKKEQLITVLEMDTVVVEAGKV